ncbi:uncharacterized protein OCT59_005599 [Rhizophagus irregularis]|uniref:uncharacterized protein n=1 Tax=Rhizophagus irregularis TaxID=588596 RepID=UPI003323678B|nr:hypothetical protein OCT59_005599 [Rhizophagus irregularis]
MRSPARVLPIDRKRKANRFRRSLIVADAEKFYFMECTMDDQDRPSFKLSEPVVVVYNNVNMENIVREVLSHIVGRSTEAGFRFSQ